MTRKLFDILAQRRGQATRVSKEEVMNKIIEEQRRLAALSDEQVAERRRERQQEEIDYILDRAVWIVSHGSDYLRRMYARGEDVQRRYVAERAALELPPGFVVDIDYEAQWEPAESPSLEARRLAQDLMDLGYRPRVVRLWQPATGEYDDQPEAVMVDFHGFKAFKILS